MLVHLTACIFMYCVCVSAHRGKEEGPGLLDLGIPATVCYPMDAGTQTRFSPKVTNALKYLLVSLAPNTLF